MTLPPIPDAVPSPLGPVPVVFVETLSEASDDFETFGLWDMLNRVIKIREGLPIAVQWQTLYHEMTHVAIWDAGLHNVLTEDCIEILCDVLGCARVMELTQR